MHNEFTTLMSEILDHEAPPGEAQRLQAHLNTCPSCAQTWAQWRSLDSFLSDAPRLAPPGNFVLRVVARLEEQRERQRRRRWLGSGLLVTWAAIVGVFWLGLLIAGIWSATHPDAVGLWATSWAATAGGVAEVLRSLQGALLQVGLLPLSLGLGFYLCVTGLLAAIWLWVMVRKSAWSQVLSPAGGPLAE